MNYLTIMNYFLTTFIVNDPSLTIVKFPAFFNVVLDGKRTQKDIKYLVLHLALTTQLLSSDFLCIKIF